jgi:ribosomal protein L5
MWGTLGQVGGRMAKLKEVYQEKVVPALIKRFNYKNGMEVLGWRKS